MPINPIEMQVIIPKTSEIAKVYSDEHHKSQALQKQQADSIQQKAENELKQVYSREKAHEAKIRDEQGKRQGGGSSGESNKRSTEEKRKKEEKAGNTKTSTIDIKI